MIAPPVELPRLERADEPAVNRLPWLTLLLAVAALGCGDHDAPTVEPAVEPAAEPVANVRALTAPDEELHAVDARPELLDAARRLIETDAVATLISVDGEGRARARSVDSSGPDDEWRFWVATRPGTRKVEQIEQHPEVTLHFETDEAGGYVSVMGSARIHRDDPVLFERNNPIAPDLMPTLFPDFPHDYLLIEIRPTWLEVLTPEIEASVETWRPPIGGVRVGRGAALIVVY